MALAALPRRDLAFCHTCVLAYQRNHLQSASLLERSFISSGFSNWKDAVAKFSKHEGSRCHKDAVLKVQVLPASTRDVGEAFSEQLGKDRLEARCCFLKLLSNAGFLAQQGLALRGDGDEADSYFMRLASLRAEDFPQLQEWIRKRTDKYVSGEMQNEMLQTMAVRVLRGVVDCIQQKPFCTVMADETADAANVEQVVV